MIDKVLRFCRTTSKYKGPQESEAVQLLLGLTYDKEGAAFHRAFELGYKRGYADAADYIAGWIEEEWEGDEEGEAGD